jgi:aryl-alcohol dehydrogenase-like predicted oxidoreductase
MPYTKSALLSTPLDQTRQGKIRHIGLSEVSGTTLRRASKIAHVDAVQLEYSPFAMECEMDDDVKFGVRKVCRELGTAIVAYSPLGECHDAFKVVRRRLTKIPYLNVRSRVDDWAV